jgi:hypothetical protein
MLKFYLFNGSIIVQIEPLDYLTIYINSGNFSLEH